VTPAPIEVVEAEVKRLGYEGFDVRSFLLGFCLGREKPLDEKRIRWNVETLLGPERNAHLPKPDDAT
jgi:hypothetical protein